MFSYITNPPPQKKTPNKQKNSKKNNEIESINITLFMSDLIGSWSIDASKTGCVFPTMWLLETYEIKTYTNTDME